MVGAVVDPHAPERDRPVSTALLGRRDRKVAWIQALLINLVRMSLAGCFWTSLLFAETLLVLRFSQDDERRMCGSLVVGALSLSIIVLSRLTGMWLSPADPVLWSLRRVAPSLFFRCFGLRDYPFLRTGLIVPVYGLTDSSATTRRSLFPSSPPREAGTYPSRRRVTSAQRDEIGQRVVLTCLRLALVVHATRQASKPDQLRTARSSHVHTKE